MLDPSHIAWNLFLALIPVVLALCIGWLWWRYPKLRPMWWIWTPLGVLWLGFLPNTCYLFTEWRHFIDYITRSPDEIREAAHDKGALLWFLGLATFYVIYSGAGLLAFSMAVWPIAQITNPGRLMRSLFFLLCATGVYLGLIKRLNTWDLWHHPSWVFYSAAEVLTHPLLMMLAISFALALWLNYWIFEVFVDGLLLRMRRARTRRR